jgi:hypothetical protein
MLLNKNNFLSVGANALPSDLMYAPDLNPDLTKHFLYKKPDLKRSGEGGLISYKTRLIPPLIERNQKKSEWTQCREYKHTNQTIRMLTESH